MEPLMFKMSLMINITCRSLLTHIYNSEFPIKRMKEHREMVTRGRGSIWQYVFDFSRLFLHLRRKILCWIRKQCTTCRLRVISKSNVTITTYLNPSPFRIPALKSHFNSKDNRTSTFVVRNILFHNRSATPPTLPTLLANPFFQRANGQNALPLI